MIKQPKIIVKGDVNIYKVNIIDFDKGTVKFFKVNNKELEYVEYSIDEVEVVE